MKRDLGTVQSRQSESLERNDDAVPRGQGARALFPEAVPLVPQVGRSKQPGTNKIQGTDKKKAGTAPSSQRKSVERNGSDPPVVSPSLKRALEDRSNSRA